MFCINRTLADLAAQVGIQILMNQKPVFEGVKWGFIMFWLVSTISRVCIAIILTTGE